MKILVGVLLLIGFQAYAEITAGSTADPDPPTSSGSAGNSSGGGGGGPVNPPPGYHFRCVGTTTMNSPHGGSGGSGALKASGKDTLSFTNPMGITFTAKQNGQKIVMTTVYKGETKTATMDAVSGVTGKAPELKFTNGDQTFQAYLNCEYK